MRRLSFKKRQSSSKARHSAAGLDSRDAVGVDVSQKLVTGAAFFPPHPRNPGFGEVRKAVQETTAQNKLAATLTQLIQDTHMHTQTVALTLGPSFCFSTRWLGF